MLIDYSALEKETIELLRNNGTGVLSTSFIDKVTSRNMCIINIGLEIYFQTNKKSPSAKVYPAVGTLVYLAYALSPSPEV